MSENLTHTAVTDDCVRLALHSPSICEPFKLALRDHLEIARLGGVTRWGDRHSTDLLARYREAWPPGHDDALAPKLAFVLGWLCHRAADRQMKPVFRRTDPDCPCKPTDCSVYHDVFVFHEVYRSGSEEPYSPRMLAAPPAPELEEEFRILMQRALLGMHTFVPEEGKPASGDVDVWLGRLLELRQRFYVDTARYAEAAANPDPDKVRRFLDEPNFYDPDDAIIRVARSIQRGRADEGIGLDDALREAGAASQYAQAVGKAYGYIRAASEFFMGRLDRETLQEDLDIGKPGG